MGRRPRAEPGDHAEQPHRQQLAPVAATAGTAAVAAAAAAAALHGDVELGREAVAQPLVLVRPQHLRHDVQHAEDDPAGCSWHTINLCITSVTLLGLTN